MCSVVDQTTDAREELVECMSVQLIARTNITAGNVIFGTACAGDDVCEKLNTLVVSRKLLFGFCFELFFNKEGACYFGWFNYR